MRRIITQAVILVIFFFFTIAPNFNKVYAQACTGQSTGRDGYCGTVGNCVSGDQTDGLCGSNSALICCIPPTSVSCNGAQSHNAGYCLSIRSCPTPAYHTEPVDNNNDCLIMTNGGICCVTSPQPTVAPSVTPSVGCQPGQNCCRCLYSGTRCNIFTDNCSSPNYVPVCTSSPDPVQCSAALPTSCTCTLYSNVTCGAIGLSCCTSGIPCFTGLCSAANLCIAGGTSPIPPQPCPANRNCIDVNTPDICTSSEPPGLPRSCSRSDGTTGDCCTPAYGGTSPMPSLVQRPTIDPLGGCGGEAVNTAVGCIPVGSSNPFIAFILRWAVGISGGIATILIVISGFLIMASSGDPRRIQAGKELLTAAVTGLLLLIFSVFILDLLGIRILMLPNF